MMVQAVATTQTSYRLVLDLTPNELVTLQGIMQNPFWNPEQPDLEPEDVKAIRKAIFNACAKHRT